MSISNRLKTHRLVLRGIVMGVACMCAAAQGADDEGWPRFRGPNNDFKISATDWEVSAEPAVVWKTSLGIGYSTAAVRDGRLVTMGFNKSTGIDTIVCFDAKTGKKIWEHRYPAEALDRAHPGGTLVTPTFAGEELYCSNREGWLFCFDPSNGDVKWKKQLAAEYSLSLPKWGFAGSPLVIDDVLYMNVGHLIAFDRHTGKEIWRSEKKYGDTYAVPVEFSRNGKSALAAFMGEGLVIFDRSSGEEIMMYPWTNRAEVNAAAPIVMDGGKRVFISSGYNRGCAMLDVTGDEPKVLWENKDMRNHMSGSILHEDHLYGFDESQYRCMDLEGNVVWTERGVGKGAHMMAGERLILLSGQGEVIVLHANPEKWDVEQKVKVLDGGQYWTNPVLVDGYLYCRNSLGDLVCLDCRKQ